MEDDGVVGLNWEEASIACSLTVGELAANLQRIATYQQCHNVQYDIKFNIKLKSDQVVLEFREKVATIQMCPYKCSSFLGSAAILKN